jgi:glycosyltransferase involved in cell wall biosynthesis
MLPHKKKKILFLITKSNWGGAQRYVHDLAVSLPKNEFDIAVALGGEGHLLTKLEANNIKTIKIASLQRDISFTKEIQSFKEIWYIIKTEKPNVLHVNSSKAGGLGAFAGRLLKVPKIIYSAHGWAFNEDINPVSRLAVGLLHWLTIMLAHQTIAVSNATKSQMKWPFTQKKITVIHNGRPLPNFLDRNSARHRILEIKPDLISYQNDLWTVTIAELHPIKCHHLMIEAVEKLTKSGIKIRHLIIGDGELRNELTQLIKDKNLEQSVFLLGHINEADQLLKGLDIFVSTSRSESLGYSVIEASQAGLPIISTKVGGVPEIITDGLDGLLIAPNDSQVLATSLELLINDANLRIKISQAAKVRGQHFSLERMIDDTTTLYNL